MNQVNLMPNEIRQLINIEDSISDWNINNKKREGYLVDRWRVEEQFGRKDGSHLAYFPLKDAKYPVHFGKPVFV